MTEDESYAAGWHAGHEGLKHETRTSIGGEMSPEIRADEMLSAAWLRGFDEGKRAQYDERYPV